MSETRDADATKTAEALCRFKSPDLKLDPDRVLMALAYAPGIWACPANSWEPWREEETRSWATWQPVCDAPFRGDEGDSWWGTADLIRRKRWLSARGADLAAAAHQERDYESWSTADVPQEAFRAQETSSELRHLYPSSTRMSVTKAAR